MERTEILSESINPSQEIKDEDNYNTNSNSSSNIRKRNTNSNKIQNKNQNTKKQEETHCDKIQSQEEVPEIKQISNSSEIIIQNSKSETSNKVIPFPTPMKSEIIEINDESSEQSNKKYKKNSKNKKQEKSEKNEKNEKNGKNEKNEKIDLKKIILNADTPVRKTESKTERYISDDEVGYNSGKSINYIKSPGKSNNKNKKNSNLKNLSGDKSNQGNFNQTLFDYKKYNNNNKIKKEIYEEVKKDSFLNNNSNLWIQKNVSKNSDESDNVLEEEEKNAKTEVKNEIPIQVDELENNLNAYMDIFNEDKKKIENEINDNENIVIINNNYNSKKLKHKIPSEKVYYEQNDIDSISSNGQNYLKKKHKLHDGEEKKKYEEEAEDKSYDDYFKGTHGKGKKIFIGKNIQGVSKLVTDNRRKSENKINNDTNNVLSSQDIKSILEEFE